MRNLTQHEIDSLTGNHCVAEDWTQIFVSEDFSPEHISFTRFSGRITLGRFVKTFQLAGGLCRHSGIRNATLHHCEILFDVLFQIVANLISYYPFCDYCYILTVNVIAVYERSTFGINVFVIVLYESCG